MKTLNPQLNATFSQFCQHFTSSFCTNILSSKNTKSNCLSREKLHKTLLYEKAAHKMLVISPTF